VDGTTYFIQVTRPYFFKTKVNSLNAFETRGTWEVVNDYMAGPFLNYYIKDSQSDLH
jgi:hypothetical protein